jgi:hypothetical protein
MINKSGKLFIQEKNSWSYQSALLKTQLGSFIEKSISFGNYLIGFEVLLRGQSYPRKGKQSF